MSIKVYSRLDAQAVLEAHSKGVDIPWVFVRSAIFGFMDILREKGLLLCAGEDSATVNQVQEQTTVEGRNFSLNVRTGEVFVVLWLTESKARVDAVGRELKGLAWADVRATVMKFLEHLHYHNIWVAQTAVLGLVHSKSCVQSVHLRLKNLAEVAPTAPKEG